MSLFMRWLHFASVIIAVGGTAFVRLALLPALARQDSTIAAPVAAAVMRRYVPILHTAILGIILSGLYNLFTLELPFGEARGVYHALLGLKLVLALIIFTIAILVTARSPRLSALHQKRGPLLALNLLLAATVIALSAYLRSLR